MSALDLASLEAADTAELHLRSAKDEPLYFTPDGADAPQPVRITLYGPGSEPYQAAQAKAQRRMLSLLKGKGKGQASEPLPDAERRAANAQHLADITHSIEGIAYQGMQGRDLAVAIYQSPKLGYIAEQVNRFSADWANFMKG